MYKEYDKESLDKLHETLVEILDEFVRVCKKHNLKYTLVAGTLLGAKRHSGFIPWDDDVDVGMLREDYEKFLEVAPKELKKDYILDCFENNKKYHLGFAKIKKNGTIFDEKSSHHLDNHKGIYIDVFPVDNLYDNTKKSYFIAILVRAIIHTTYAQYKIDKLSNARHKILSGILYIFPHTWLMKLQKFLMTLNKNNNSKYVACFLGVYPFKNEIIKREDFVPFKEIEFMGKKYGCPNNTDVYLTSVYGDYMKLPPKEKRVNHMPLKLDFGKKK